MLDMFSNHNEITLQIINRNISGKSLNIWKLLTLRQNPWAKKDRKAI